MESTKCSVCLESKSNLVKDFCTQCPVENALCIECLTEYIQQILSNSYMGYCPTIKCPFEHSDERKGIIMYNTWANIVYPQLSDRYQKLAESVLDFKCSQCHANSTLLFPYSARSLANEQNIIKFSELQGNFNIVNILKNYSAGIISVDECYRSINDTLPVLALKHYQEAFECMSVILSSIEDPGRRANLQLRHFNIRPQIWTNCCRKEHCFRCLTKAHGEKSCNAYLNSLKECDNVSLFCPSCNVCLTKGDGCDSITCFCGKHFQWSTEKMSQVDCSKFLSMFPVDTDLACVHILCGTWRASSSVAALAKSWKLKNSLSVSASLAHWWQLAFPECPNQCAVLFSSDSRVKLPALPSNETVIEACTMWKKVNSVSVRILEKERNKAISLLFPALISADNEINVLKSIQNKSFYYCNDFITKSLKESAKMWTSRTIGDHNADSSESLKLCEQFLLLLGGQSIFTPCNGRSIETLSANDIISPEFVFVEQWDVENSNDSLTFSNNHSSVMRDGGISCYPCAFAKIPQSKAVFSVVIEQCPLTCNMVTFGLIHKALSKPSFQNFQSGSRVENNGFPVFNNRGVGRSAGSYGITDDRSGRICEINQNNSLNRSIIYDNGSEIGHGTKFQQGDVLRGLVDTEAGTFEITHIHSVESAKMVQEKSKFLFNIPKGRADDYVFAVTLANNHMLTLTVPPPQLRRSSSITGYVVNKVRSASEHMGNDFQNDRLRAFQEILGEISSSDSMFTYSPNLIQVFDDERCSRFSEALRYRYGNINSSIPMCYNVEMLAGIWENRVNSCIKDFISDYASKGSGGQTACMDEFAAVIPNSDGMSFFEPFIDLQRRISEAVHNISVIFLNGDGVIWSTSHSGRSTDDHILSVIGPLLTWNGLLQCAAWWKVKNEQEAFQYAQGLSEIFVAEHDSSALLISTLLCCNAARNSGEYDAFHLELAKAFMKVNHHLVNEFYEINSLLETPEIDNHDFIPHCRCVPRHIARTSNADECPVRKKSRHY